MHVNQSGFYKVEAEHADLVRAAGLTDAMSVFDNPKIVVWRDIKERQNCVLDVDDKRLHIKRDKAGFSTSLDEVNGLQLLKKELIPTTPLVGHGKLNDGRGFVITLHLDGYSDCEQLVLAGTLFETLLIPTAQLAGQLHRDGLHHRDLYLCHFFAKVEEDVVGVRLIDAAPREALALAVKKPLDRQGFGPVYL